MSCFLAWGGVSMPLSTTISLDALEGGMWASFMVEGGEDMSVMGKHRIGNKPTQMRSKCYFLSKGLAGGILENSDWRATTFGHIAYIYIIWIWKMDRAADELLGFTWGIDSWVGRPWRIKESYILNRIDEETFFFLINLGGNQTKVGHTVLFP